ncbi:MAG: hypothetical protein LH614_12835 [Pyrinomonadaceae bacterium]|nr:hypothetical protein [Pyrinomonadaceae bacterium]
MKKKVLSLIFSILLLASLANAQTAEVSVALSEQFFDSLLDAIFKNFNAPEFPLAQNNPKPEVQNPKSLVLSYSNDNSPIRNSKFKTQNCSESIRLLREVDGVKTTVRFRDGKIYAPIAFSGSYNPPLIGCIDFQGWAETNIDLEYNRQSQKLLGRVRVLSVNLGGVTNLASGVLSRLVQSSIDKKINPIEILQADKLSFIVPIQNANGSLKMKAVGIRHEINNGVLNVNIAYEFSKGN